MDALELVKENGPWVYELFAVLIHSGSALGGHYYANIKSLGDDGELTHMLLVELDAGVLTRGAGQAPRLPPSPSPNACVLLSLHRDILRMVR